MNGSEDLIEEFSKLAPTKHKYIIICPPFTLLDSAKTLLPSFIKIGAQNSHDEIDKGPFTGSISPKMIKNLGADYVILGHSENRENGENNFMINKKIKSALKKNNKVFYSSWNDFSMGPEERIKYIIDVLGSGMVGGPDIEEMAKIGREFKGRKIPY